jgi:hypothetical protein
LSFRRASVAKAVLNVEFVDRGMDGTALGAFGEVVVGGGETRPEPKRRS